MFQTMTITKSFFPASHIVTHPEMFLLLLLLLPGKVRYVKVQSSVVGKTVSIVMLLLLVVVVVLLQISCFLAKKFASTVG